MSCDKGQSDVCLLSDTYYIFGNYILKKHHLLKTYAQSLNDINLVVEIHEYSLHAYA